MRASLLLLLTLCSASMAASPQLQRISPAGGQRGTEVQVILEGARLKEPRQLLIYDAGISVVSLAPVSDKQAKATLRIAPDARLGEHQLRLYTAGGITELRTFWVGALPCRDEAEPNNEFEKPQKIELNSTIQGGIAGEDVDYFVVECRKGQRLTVEVEGIRLGGVMFDPSVAILDSRRFEVDGSDDTPLLAQDPVVSIVCPDDGRYVIQVRDSAYNAGGGARFRLHVGTFPRPRIAWPLGGQAGQKLSVTLLGDVAGPIPQAVQLPAGPEERFAVYAAQESLLAPSPNWLRVSPFAAAAEREPNPDQKSATPVELAAPFAVDGVVSEAGDNDYFRFAAKKGQALDVHVYARRLRSPLDPLVYVYDKAGKVIVNNDDSGGPDPYVRFNPPEDGEFFLRVRDHLRGGSPLHVYRLEVTPVRPALVLSIPNVGANPSQERQAIAIPRGGRFATPIRASRQDFGGELELSAEKLPAGVKMHVERLPAGADQFIAVFEAAVDAPAGAVLTRLMARGTDPKTPVEGELEQVVELVGGPNNTSFYQTRTSRLAVAVIDPAPFAVSIVKPKHGLPQNGAMPLRVRVERQEGFKGAVAVRLAANPPGVSAGSGISIPPDKSEADIPLSAAAGAAVTAWPVAVLGSADVGGTLWVSSPMEKLEVAPAMVEIRIQPATIERGQAGQVTCAIAVKTPFPGKAKLALRGLPANVTAPEIEITAAETKAVFAVATTAKSPPGQHKNLSCALTLERDGQTIRQNAGAGGMLRIDPPAVVEGKP